MRIPVMLTSLIFATTVGANAQDLQYRMNISTEIAGSPMKMPASDILFSIKDGKMRMDVELPSPRFDVATPEVQMTALLDRANRKIIMLLPDGEIMEQALPTIPDVDTAAQAKLNETVVVQEKAELQTISGFETRRVLAMVDMPEFETPVPGMPTRNENERLIMISESWLSTDTLLARVYKAHESTLAAGGGLVGQTIPTAHKYNGLPVRTTMLLGVIPKNDKVSAEDVVAGKAPAFKLHMRTVLEMRDIKTGLLDSALFVVPKKQ